MKELIKLIAGLEGRKVQVSVGNIREVIRCLSDLVANDPELYAMFKHYIQGKQRRAIAAKKSKKEAV